MLLSPSLAAKLALFTNALSTFWGETPNEVALQARSLLHDHHTFGVGVLSTTFHDDYSDPDLRGMVSSGPEYFAPCFDNGDVLMLAMPVSQNWRNALTSATHNATLSIGSSPDPRVPDPRFVDKRNNHPAWDPARPSWRRGMPSKQRLTLFGHIERVHASDDETQRLAKCYLHHHPDARHWAPGSHDSPHVAFWSRFVAHRVYRVGGFGDEANIGWVDMQLWRSATNEDGDESMSDPPLHSPSTQHVLHA